MGFKLRFIQDDSVDETEVIVRARTQDDEVAKILKTLSSDSNGVIISNTLSSKYLIYHSDILLISREGRHVFVRTTSGECMLNEPLYRIEERLNPTWFLRISQSEIVNLRHVKGWSLTRGGTIRIELSDGTTTSTSRRYAVKIRMILKKGSRQNEVKTD